MGPAEEEKPAEDPDDGPPKEPFKEEDEVAEEGNDDA